MRISRTVTSITATLLTGALMDTGYGRGVNYLTPPSDQIVGIRVDTPGVAVGREYA